MTKQALIAYGGREGHEPEATSRRFATILEGHGYEVAVHNSLNICTDADAMATFDLIIPNFSHGAITPEQESGMLSAIKAGAGLAGRHGGMGDAFRNNPE